MGDPQHPLQPGEPAPGFMLPAANREGMVSLADLRGRPFVLGLFRGLHCPFCRRQVRQLADMQPALRAAGVETVAVINTPVERARMYFRYRPMSLLLLADPDCRTHQAFGVPRVEFLTEGSSESPEWPSRTRMADFEAARINPTGELPQPAQPMAANGALNAQDGFEMDGTDSAIMANHASQLVGHFLIDESGTIAWEHIEAPNGPSSLCYFPDAKEIVTAAGTLQH
ncbi:Putative peroxiredoxin bcp [Variovorax sp. PBL-H6]|uniref:peroxiredoxin-like family protein n=1 Tax=Variovorax sp. PBL-H6 TaxID=434009 RepID=UPI001316234D|nr:peroxiredoxin-like family protein [Variovorax sp. PBL-H6]VTU39603.1 Putative peroxiredoxin bcp [Variovorax sp. PBL-H6]